MKAEEQLIHDIVVFEERITREINLTESVDGEEITKLKIRQMNAVKSYFELIASKQREACKIHYEYMWGKGMHSDVIKNTPLVTTKTDNDE